MAVDYLALEDRLIERLSTFEALAGRFVTIAPVASTDKVLEQSQVTPAAYVTYMAADTIEAQSHDAKSLVVAQYWAVILAVRYQHHKTARTEMGGLIYDTMRALNGWKPEPEGLISRAPLTRVAGPVGLEQAGFLYFAIQYQFPLVFPVGG